MISNKETYLYSVAPQLAASGNSANATATGGRHREHVTSVPVRDLLCRNPGFHSISFHLVQPLATHFRHRFDFFQTTRLQVLELLSTRFPHSVVAQWLTVSAIHMSIVAPTRHPSDQARPATRRCDRPPSRSHRPLRAGAFSVPGS